MEELTGYFTSSINWCEFDFEYSTIIVESYNSWSSLLITLAGLIGISAFSKTKHLAAILVGVGLGSFYFHTTLSLLGQLLDEGFILLEISATLHYLQSIRQIHISKKIMGAIELTIILVFIVAPELNRYVLLIYGVSATLFVRKHLKNVDDDTKELFDSAALIFIGAIGCWIVDQLCMPEFSNIYLHAIWHGLVACASFTLFSGIDKLQ